MYGLIYSSVFHMQPVNVMSVDKSPVRIVGFDDIEFAPRFEYGEMAEVAGVCGSDDGSELVVEQLRIDGYRASQIGQSKAQSAGNGMSPFQGLQRGIGRFGALPSGQPGSSHLRCCAPLN